MGIKKETIIDFLVKVGYPANSNYEETTNKISNVVGS